MSLVSILLCVVFAGFGFLVGWRLSSERKRAQYEGTLGELKARTERLTQIEAELAETRDRLESARIAAAETAAQLKAEQAAAQEKFEAISTAEERLKASFDSLASAALDRNARQLLQMSRSELDSQNQTAKTALIEQESAIAALLQPMGDSLAQLAAHAQQLEVKREGAYQAIQTQIEGMQRSHTELRRETAQLVQALRAPKVRGNWGEMQLRRCVEYAGMVEHASFDVQRFVRGEDTSIQPDLIVHLPNGRCIVVDAKTPLDAFLNASGCENEEQRQAYLAQHAAAVEKHLEQLSAKAYWSRFVGESPDFVVCFLPSEVLFSAALEQNPALIETSAGANVLLATPTTLIALLKAVACGWQQSQIARDAGQIRDAALKVQSKLADMHTAFLDLGSALRRAGDKYDDMLVKAEGRGGLFSIARRLRELKVGEKEIGESRPVALRPRVLEHEDWQPGLALAAAEETAFDRSEPV